MDFFTLLKQDHKDAKEAFRTILREDNINHDETDVLCHKLLLHMEMEEKYFYPLMEEYKATEELSKEAELEHSEAKKFIKALLKNNLDEAEYKVKLEMLKLGIEHHIEEEETEVLPQAQKRLSKEKVQEITKEMLALKEKKQSTISG